MAFAASIGEPPPTASTASARDSRNRATPSITTSMVGSGSTSENTCASTPASSNAASTGSTTLSLRSTSSVTTRAERAPRSAIIWTSWVDDPGPVNMNGVGAGTSLVAIPNARTRRRATRWFIFESFFGCHVDGVSANLAQELTNPVASVIQVPFQNNFDWGGGPHNDAFRYTLNIDR